MTHGDVTLGSAGLFLAFGQRREARAIMIGRILNLTVLALTGFLGVVLSGHLWARYVEETAALGFDGIYERFQASQAGLANDPIAYRAAAEVERARQSGQVLETAALEE